MTVLSILSFIVDALQPTVAPPSADGEVPLYNKSVQYELYLAHIPESTPDVGTPEYGILKAFAREVVLILQTVNENEYQAATVFMRPPTAAFSKAVFYPMTSMVVGIFAGKKTALIQARVGEYVADYVSDALKAFPKTKYVIGVGVCYAFDRNEYNFADVLVSDKIADLQNFKFLGNDEIQDRGQTVNVVFELVRIFALNMNIVPEFQVTTGGRYAKVDRGTILSYSVLMNNLDERDKFHRAVPKAKGGEMEGRELIQFEERGEVDGVIIIKGIVDFADGTKDKDWQFTAALAALAYTYTKLDNVPDDFKLYR